MNYIDGNGLIKQINGNSTILNVREQKYHFGFSTKEFIKNIYLLYTFYLYLYCFSHNR